MNTDNFLLQPKVEFCDLPGHSQLGIAEKIHHFIYTGCPKRNVPNFGRVFLMLNYTDITQNTYVQSWTVAELMAREKRGLLAGPRTVPVTVPVL